ncbi:MAG: ribonuclease P protein component [Clostridia bacterium]|nr:ribonuclease P protein component [Clostridia bacterium]
MKEFAIKENHLFVKAYQGGKRYVTDTVTVYVLKDLKAGRLRKENPQKEFLNRIGFTATTKLGHAVVRNRAKRVMRAAYRNIISVRPIKTGNLIVITARDKIREAGSAQVERDMNRAFNKLELFK